MPSSVLLPLASIGFAVLAFLFARNVRTGLRTGRIFVQSASYSRAEHPFFFWFGAVLYSALTIGAIGAACLGVWTAIALN
jgi:hypothetical protein